MYKKLCLVYNYAQHYRQEIFQLLDKELDCDFYFGDKMGDVKKLDYNLLHNFQTELENHRIGNSFYYQKGINKCLRKNYTDYIFLGEVRCLSTWWALFYCKFSKKKIHLWTHGWYGKESFLEKTLKKAFYSLADNILLYGDYAKQLMIKEGFNSKKLHVIYNSLAYDKQLSIRNKLRSSDVFERHFSNSNKNLLFIGRLSSEKKLGMILEAMKLLRKENQNFNLTLIGNGVEKESLELKCRDFGLERFVWFYGACYDEEELSHLIYNADLCVSPGNVGLTAMHCMSFGLPILTHDDFSMQMPEFEAVEEGKTGAYFKYGDVVSLKNSISIFFQNNKNRDKIRELCYNVIDEKFNPHVQLKTIKNVINL